MCSLLAFDNHHMKKNSALIFLFGYSAFFFQNLFTLYFNYINNNTANLFLTAGFYVSMTLGALLALRYRKVEFSLPAVHLFAAVIYLVSFLILFTMPSLSIPALILSLIGVGASQSIIFRQENIRSVIIWLSLGSIAYFATAAPLFAVAGQWLILVCLLIPTLAAFTDLRRPLLNVAFASFAGVCFVSQLLGVFSPPSWQETHRFRQFEPKKLATVFTPTIITDFIDAQGLHYIITNGSRFSRVYDRYINELYEKNPLYDSPYAIKKPGKVLIIGPAGGLNVYRALENGADQVFAVDINPAVAEFGIKRFPDISLNLYRNPKVQSITAEGRSFVESSTEKYDLIVVQGVQTGTMATVAANAFMESFLFTNESIQAMRRSLNDGGLIFFEEDSVWSEHERALDLSVLKNLHWSAAKAGLVNERNSLLYQYTIPAMFPTLRNRAPIHREVLLIGKNDFFDAKTAIQQQFTKFDIKFLDVLKRTDLLTLTDNRPYLVSQEFGDYRIPIIVALLCVTVVIAWFSFRITRRQHLLGVEASAMFFSGACYTLLLVSLAGPMYLLSGNPNTAVLLINLALVVSSLVLAFVRFYTVSKRFIRICVAYLAVLGVFFIFKDSLVYATIANASYGLRLAVAVTVAVFLFLFIEAPYYAILARGTHDHRPAYFLLGKFGAFWGVFFGLVCQLQFGFYQSMAVCLATYLISLILLSSRAKEQANEDEIEKTA